MKSYSSREVIRILTEDGWYEVSCVGDHHQYKHPVKPGKVTIPANRKDLNIKTWNSIMRQAGLR